MRLLRLPLWRAPQMRVSAKRRGVLTATSGVGAHANLIIVLIAVSVAAVLAHQLDEAERPDEQLVGEAAQQPGGAAAAHRELLDDRPPQARDRAADRGRRDQQVGVVDDQVAGTVGLPFRHSGLRRFTKGRRASWVKVKAKG